MTGLGTIVNAGAIILGSLIGVAIGQRFAQRYQSALVKALGLVTIALGIQMSLKESDLLMLAGSMAFGALLGEWIDIEGHLQAFAVALRKRFSSIGPEFNEGFVGATLLFCVGSMAILGAIQDGVKNDHSILFVKAVLDGVFSIALASSLGFGVLLSFFPVLLYQGGITIIASFMGDIASDTVINQLTATGGLLMIGLGMNMMELTKLKVGNLLPALAFSILFSVIVPYFRFL